MADNDVSALFQNRKAKKSGKKKFKSFSANRIVKQLQEGVPDEEIDLNKPVTEVPVNSTTLNVRGTGLEGEWVDDDDILKKPTNTLVGSGVADLKSMKAAEEAANEEIAEQEVQENPKLEFHLARAKALKEAEKKATKEEVKPEPVVEKKIWRPRGLLSRATPAGGSAAALKELDNEQVFPTLGGKTKDNTPSVAPAVWGKVDEKVLEVVEEQQAVKEPVYLGEDFIASEKFDGLKPGYAFKAGEKGVGYYWEQKKEAETAVEEKPKSNVWRPSRKLNAELPPAEDDEETPKPDGGDDRFKPSKTAWRPSRQLKSEAPPAEAEEEITKSEAVPAVETDASDMDRFAGLKKKKKKKKKAEE